MNKIKSKDKEKIKNIKISKKNNLAKNAIKLLLISSVFAIGTSYSMFKVVENKINNIVTDEQRQDFKNINSYSWQQNFISNKLNDNYYNQNKYQSDLKIMKDFDNEIIREFSLLYENNKFIKENFKIYKDNPDKFLSDYKNESNYFNSFSMYYKLQKLKNYEKNSFFIKKANLNKYYFIDNFMHSSSVKIIINENEKSKDYVSFDNSKNQIKEMLRNDPLYEEYSYSNHFYNPLINKILREKNIQSYQLSENYQDNIFSKVMEIKYGKNHKNNFNADDIRKSLNYDLLTKKAQEEIDFNIDYYLSTYESDQKKPTKDYLKIRNLKNSLMVLNVETELLKLKYHLVDIKNKNKENFDGFNYTIYNFLNQKMIKIKNIFSEEKYKDVGLFINTPFEDEKVKIDLFLSGINDNNPDLINNRETLITESLEDK